MASLHNVSARTAPTGEFWQEPHAHPQTHLSPCPGKKKTVSPGYHQVPFMCCLRTTIDPPKSVSFSASAADRMIVKLSLREHGKWCSPAPVHPPKGSEYTGIIFWEHPVAQRLSKVPEGLQSATLSSVHGWLNHSLAIASGQLGPRGFRNLTQPPPNDRSPPTASMEQLTSWFIRLLRRGHLLGSWVFSFPTPSRV